ncbi:MAG: GAF domain-containing protein [Gemmatimonadetes bacterium]|nr:GAF domain-containing protein [Gemmatimonadota bacterium]
MTSKLLDPVKSEKSGARKRVAKDILAPVQASLDAAEERIALLEGQLAEWSAIVEVGQVLTGLLDMEDVLSYVVYLAESLVGGHSAAVALRVEDEEAFILKNSSGSLRATEGQKLLCEGSVVGSVIVSGEPTLSESLSRDPRGYRLGGTQGPAVVVPIMNSGRVMGAFLVARLEGSPVFGAESIVVLQKMAAYAAIAIHNAEIHRVQAATADTLRQQAAELEGAYGTLRRSQEQLVTSEKMAALGRITAGIAHEINSPLGGILNALRAARGFISEYEASAADPDITPDDHRAIAADILNAISTAESAASKVALFVKSIKSQTRAGEGDVTVFDPATEVDATIVLLQHDLKRRRVAVFTEMQRGLRLKGDQNKFGMVVQNLISNAVDAYENRPGEVWVRLGADGKQIRLSVEDKGCGIPEELRGKIFDPFFTTKDVGKGTGLGLSMVHSVITTNYQGEVVLDSEVGRGTTFTVIIPLTPSETDHGA